MYQPARAATIWGHFDAAVMVETTLASSALDMIQFQTKVSLWRRYISKYALDQMSNLSELELNPPRNTTHLRVIQKLRW